MNDSSVVVSNMPGCDTLALYRHFRRHLRSRMQCVPDIQALPIPVMAAAASQAWSENATIITAVSSVHNPPMRCIQEQPVPNECPTGFHSMVVVDAKRDDFSSDFHHLRASRFTTVKAMALLSPGMHYIHPAGYVRTVQSSADRNTLQQKGNSGVSGQHTGGGCHAALLIR